MTDSSRYSDRPWPRVRWFDDQLTVEMSRRSHTTASTWRWLSLSALSRQPAFDNYRPGTFLDVDEIRSAGVAESDEPE